MRSSRGENTVDEVLEKVKSSRILKGEFSFWERRVLFLGGGSLFNTLRVSPIS